MNHKRSSLDDDETIVEQVFRVIIPKLDARRTMALLFLLWVAAFLLSARVNYHKGYTYAVKHINDAKEYHETCVEKGIIRREHPQKCMTSLIDKDLSVDDTALEYMIKTTSVCLVVNCYDGVVQLIDKFGWLLIGIAALLAVLGLVASRFLTSRPQNTTIICNPDGSQTQQEFPPQVGTASLRRRGELKLLPVNTE